MPFFLGSDISIGSIGSVDDELTSGNVIPMSNPLSSFSLMIGSGNVEIRLMFVKGDIHYGEDLAGQGMKAFITLLSVRK